MMSDQKTNAQRPDPQRSKVYAAEQLVRRIFLDADAAEAVHGPAARQIVMHGSTLVLPVERRFGELASIQRYVEAVLTLNWVAEINPHPALSITVRRYPGQKKAHYQREGVTGPEIAIPTRTVEGQRWAMRELVVLHEITHHLCPDGAHHGPDFAAIFLTLVEGVIGPEAAMLLRSAFHDTGVRLG